MSDKTKKPKRHMGVFVRLDDTTHDSWIGHTRHSTWVRAFPVILQYARGGVLQDEPYGEAVDFKFCGNTSEHPEFDHLQATTLLGSDVGPQYQTIGAGDIAYHDIYKVSLYEIERMAKALRALLKRLEKINQQVGYHMTFGQYVVRFANAIGARYIILKRDKDSEERSGSKWRFLTLEHGGQYVDRLIAEWNKQYAPAHMPEKTEAEHVS